MSRDTERCECHGLGHEFHPVNRDRKRPVPLTEAERQAALAGDFELADEERFYAIKQLLISRKKYPLRGYGPKGPLP